MKFCDHLQSKKHKQNHMIYSYTDGDHVVDKSTVINNKDCIYTIAKKCEQFKAPLCLCQICKTSHDSTHKCDKSVMFKKLNKKTMQKHNLNNLNNVTNVTNETTNKTTNTNYSISSFADLLLVGYLVFFPCLILMNNE